MLARLLVASVVAIVVTLGSTTEARADVSDKAYIIGVASTVSGTFASRLKFDAADGDGEGKFTLLAEDGTLGLGKYQPRIGTGTSLIKATGISVDGYVGHFTATSVGPIIIGSGRGTVGDTFMFVGFTRD